MKTPTQNLTVNMESITPDVAKRMLALNISNRPLNELHVAHLAREMKLGRWKINGDTICLNGSRLIDGQHRLAAVIQSGCTIQSLVVYGVAADVFDTKDTGRRRSPADTLAVRGEINTNLLAASLAIVDRYMTGRMTRKTLFTNIEMEELLEKYGGIRDVINQNKHRAHRTRLLPGSLLAACHYLLRRLDEEQADEFIKDLVTGQNLQEGDGVYLLRERLMNNVLSKAKLPKEYIMALIIKAWNSRRTGKPLRNLRFRTEGHAEEFPIAI